MVSAQSNITRVEYFFNTDPGFGNGTPVNGIPAAPDISEQAFSADLSALPVGLNNLFIRSRDQNGKWSVTNSFLFIKSATSSTLPNITKVEYFIDSDPGFGNAFDIPLPAGVVVADKSFDANIGTLAAGIHFLVIRARDANGRWSISNIFNFVRTNSASTPSSIVQMEYFFDSDPGFGNGIAIPIAASSNIADQVFQPNLTNLVPGLHFLFIRSRDAMGNWSVTNSFLFLKSAATGITNVVAAEYFFDTDPGFGKGTNIPVSPSSNIVNVSSNINIAGLGGGHHMLFLRTRDAQGQWSVTGAALFVRAGATVPADIVRMEAFIDTDPGFGNGIPIANNPATDLPDFAFPLNVSGLSAGMHRYYIRTQDVNGKWSVTARDSFNITTPASAPYINVNAITGRNFCGEKQFKLSYHAVGSYNSGNIFSVQLSDGSGSFANPVVIGSATTIGSAVITCTVPQGIANGDNYRVRVVSSNPAVTGATSDSVFVLNTQPRFADETAIVVCANETANLNAVYNTGFFNVSWSTPNPAAAPIGQYTMITVNPGALNCKDTSVVTVRQDVNRWQGTVNSDWHTAANWSTGAVPTLKTHVIIQASTPNPCILSGQNGEAASIQVRQGAIMQATGGKVVNVAANCNPLPN
jgi:hypothetical protein